jgi:hypothetical protein
MKGYSTALSGCILLQAFLTDTEAFSPHHRTQIMQQPTTRSSLYLFGRNKDDDKEKSEETKEKGGLLPFFGRRVLREEAVQNIGDTESEQPVPATPEAAPMPTPTPKPAKKEPVNAQDAAKSLRARAERMKLEAERMDAELTLEKIEKLERQLAKARSKGGAVDDLQRQMDNLQAKLRGEAPKPVMEPKREVTKKEEPLKPKISDTTPLPANKSENSLFMDRFSKPGAMLDTIVKDTGGQMQSQMILGDEFEEVLEGLKNAPSFLKKIMAATVEVDYDTIDDLNITEVAVRSTMLRSGDYSYSTMSKPSFTKKQIEEEAKKLEDTEDSLLPVSEPMIELAAGNYTKLAIYGLEYEYYTTSKLQDEETAMAQLAKIAEGEEWLGGIIQAVNQSAVDQIITQLFPKCTREEDGVPTNAVTDAQIQMLASSVLSKTKFSATGKPEPVLGGFVIRGNHKYESGDELIAAIDKELERSPLGDKMTVLYTDDFTFIARAEEADFDFNIFDPENNPPVLYVLGPNICREPKPIQLSIVSALGLSTLWYLSIYPFLLNPGLSKLIEEQLGLAEAGMPFDLNWLTDLSLPLFYTLIGLQLSHEFAHRAIAGINDVSRPRGLSIIVCRISPSLCHVFLSDKNFRPNLCSFSHYRCHEHSDHLQNSTQEQGSHVRLRRSRPLIWPPCVVGSCGCGFSTHFAQ